MRIEDPGLIGNRRFSAFVKRTGSVAWKPAPSLAAALTVVAIAGKQACSLGVLGKGADRLSVGLGVIPRGEVGLIFANVGLALTVGGRRVVDEATFSAVVVMVTVTTVVTPPALKWSLGRLPGTEGKAPSNAGGQ